MGYFERDKMLQGEKLRIYNDICKLVHKYYALGKEKGQNFRLHESTIDADTTIALLNTVLDGQITMGPLNTKYEIDFSNYLNGGLSHSCNSGSSANLLAVSALIEAGKLNKGDKVIVPALSWSTTVFPIVQAGLIPVFIDQSDTDYNIDLSQVEKRLKEGGISAVMLIHTYGCPVDMDRCMDLAEKYNVEIIEDTCESLGAKWGDRYVGTFGICGTYSSYYSHHICTLEGGVVVTSDKNISEVIKSVRSHGWVRHLDETNEVIRGNDSFDKDFLFIHKGYNLRLSEPQAAMGIEQLKNLQQYIHIRQRNGKIYEEIFNGYSQYVDIQSYSSKGVHSYFGFPLVLKNDAGLKTIEKIKGYLKHEKIESRPFLAGNFAKQPVMKSIESEVPYALGICDKLQRNSFALPCHQGLEKEDIEYIANKVVRAVELYAS